jgi:non-specific serine/threonine protein kinase
MTLTRSQQILVQALEALPPNNVYVDAGKREILGGFKLFVEHQVLDIAWEGDGVLLFHMPASASVRIFLDGKRLNTRCSCSPEHEGKCAHIVCALVTIIHLLKPKVFRMTGEESGYRARLEAGLFKRSRTVTGEETGPLRGGTVISLEAFHGKRSGRPVTSGEGDASPFQVFVEGAGRNLRASVEMGGERIGDWANLRTVPWEIAYLAKSGREQDMSLSLFAFLRRAGNRYPIYYREEARVSKVEWAGEAALASWTELDIRGKEIVAKKGCSAGGDRKTPAILVGDFAFDLERGRLWRVERGDGWHYWDLLRSACLNHTDLAASVKETRDWEIHIPVERFRRFQLFLRRSRVKEMLGSVACMVEGAEVPVRLSHASRYRLAITTRGKGGFVINGECWSGTYSFQPSQRIISFVRAVEFGRIPLSMRTKKRRPLLYGALFDGLALVGREALDEALKHAVNERTFGRSLLVSQACRLIRGSIRAFKAEDLQFHYTGRGWELIFVDKEKEKLLFLLPYRAFGPALFERVVTRGEPMSMAEDELLPRLHILHALAREGGIELSLDGCLVEQVAWELELDATGGTIDWFEVRPEIRCNGKAIPRELWEQALSRKGVMVHGGSIQILDEKSLAALAALAGLWGGAKSAGGPRQITSIPRLRIIDLFSLRKQGIAVRLNAEDEALMARLSRFRKIEERPVAEGLRTNLRHYQKEGYYWLAFLYEHRFGACLADDMGLGKTVQAIALLGAMKEGKVALPSPDSASDAGHRFLIVVPPSLIFNWEKEIERFYPGLKVYVYRGRGRSAKREGWDVMITSYGLIRRDIAALKQARFTVIIFDEAQAIKNIFADTTHAARQLKGLFKIALTGTPIENHVGEYFSIMDLVLPGLLGEYREFQGRARQDLASLLPVVKERTKPFVLRRTKDLILQELPPKVERDVYLELTEQQKKFYNRTVLEVRSTIDAAYRGKTASQAKIIALTAIMKLRQICLTPQLLVKDLREPAPKIEFLKEKLEELCGESHSALVFSQFTSFLDLVEAELRPKDLLLLRLDGSTPVRKRKEIIEAFQESETPAVFLLSLKAGGQGLNLTRGSYVFHLDPWWNPAVENQASDRSHRIGQVNKVIVTRLLMRHTVEEKMTALKQRKLSLYRALMESPEKSGARAITREDFEFLLA